MWNFPNCLGALDGKHVVIRQPSKSGSRFYNYKNTFSIVLLALVDAHNRFVFIDIGSEGRFSDGGVYRDCHLNEALEKNALGIPCDQPFPNRTDPMPFYFVADDAFPLRNNIMKPFPHRNLNPKQRIYNYRLSRARRCVENAFGVMASRFRVFLTTINLEPDKVESVVMACCALHNLLRTVAPTRYSAHFECQQGHPNNLNVLPGAQVEGRRSVTQSAKAVREYICEYVNSDEGSVSWQNKMA